MSELIKSVVDWLNETNLFEIFIGVGPLILLVGKNFIENYNNEGIEHKLSSNFARISVSFIMYSVLFISYSVLVYLLTIGTTVRKDWVYGISILVTSGLITTALWWFIRFITSAFFPKYDYYLEHDNAQWLLIKNNSKKGVLFKHTSRKETRYMFVESLDFKKIRESKSEIKFLKFIAFLKKLKPQKCVIFMYNRTKMRHKQDIPLPLSDDGVGGDIHEPVNRET